MGHGVRTWPCGRGSQRWLSQAAKAGGQPCTLHGNDFELIIHVDDYKDDVCVCACDFKTPGELAHTADCGSGKEESWWIKVSITIG